MNLQNLMRAHSPRCLAAARFVVEDWLKLLLVGVVVVGLVVPLE
jgi:hypothetical protein